MPDWYSTIHAARWLGVPPWELERAPLMWTLRAIAAEDAETAAQNAAAKRRR